MSIVSADSDEPALLACLQAVDVGPRAGVLIVAEHATGPHAETNYCGNHDEDPSEQRHVLAPFRWIAEGEALGPERPVPLLRTEHRLADCCPNHRPNYGGQNDDHRGKRNRF